MTPTTDENLTFEEGMARLKKLVESLQGDHSLEESLAIYKEAKALADRLEDRLEEAELSVRRLEGQEVDVTLDSSLEGRPDHGRMD